MREKKSLVEELLLPHLDAAYNLARWILGSDADAQVVVEEVYLQASKLTLGEEDARVQLLTLVRNRAWIRQHRRHSPATNSAESADRLPPALSDDERTRDLHVALSKLPIEFREILLLCEIEGWSYTQLASALDLPMTTVTSRLRQARLRLREEMAEVQRKRLPE
jgi:RNA polymerase sigma-70 factor (ECF subfamily)